MPRYDDYPRRRKKSNALPWALLAAGVAAVGVAAVVFVAVPFLQPNAAPGDGGSGIVRIEHDNAGDLVDHPEKFRGRDLKMEVAIDLREGDGPTLREQLGKSFRANGRYGIKQPMVFALPAGLSDLPAAGNGDKLTVTFRCTEGKVDAGNVVTAVARSTR